MDHRHEAGEHLEEELRYYRPQDFRLPDTLGTLKHTSSKDNPHHDRYFDALGDAGPLLRLNGCSLRLRAKPDGTFIATFKRKVKGAGDVSKRFESEAQVSCGHFHMCKCGIEHHHVELLQEDHIPGKRAREVIGDAKLVFLFAISNDRVDHHYHSENSHVVLSEDYVTFPDGSTQERIEVELVHGQEGLLEDIAQELQALYPDLQVCKRGKLSDGRRRHVKLLTG
jgi:CYTH domain